VRFTLEHNPLLQAVREQRGFAQGSVVLARTYPYNPVLQTVISGVSGPTASDITNHVFNATIIRLDVEWRGQGTHRRAAAGALVTRTEWEIATQEVATTVAAVRAFNAAVYRRRKLDVLEDTVQYADDVVTQVKKLVELGRLRPTDLILARTELDAARAQLGQGRTALAVARADLRRQLGTLDDSFEVKGELDVPVPDLGAEAYTQAAQERPDLHARKAAVAEAQARYRLQVADRFGNPSVGPAYELNETNDSFMGVTLYVPLPLFNTRQGEILQAKAVLARALADARQIEVQSAQDVQAALARLAEARKWVDSYKTEVLPNLRRAVNDMIKLLEQNDPGADAVRVLSVQRNYLRAFDAYLDALFELSQARADLAAAVGDPTLALGHAPPGEKAPEKPVPLKDKP
jgi:cobalt-zinc-cadmium efflux system outer membrane protein